MMVVINPNIAPALGIKLSTCDPSLAEMQSHIYVDTLLSIGRITTLDTDLKMVII